MPTGIANREITIRRGIGNTVHDSKWRTETSAHASAEKIIDHPVPFIDDAHPAGSFLAITQESISLDQVIVSMTKDQGPLAIIKNIPAHMVAAGFYRDHFPFAITIVEYIIKDLCITVKSTMLRNPYPDDLPRITSKRAADTEIIIRDQVLIESATVIIQYHGQ